MATLPKMEATERKTLLGFWSEILVKGKHTGTSVLNQNSFQKAVWETISSKTESYSSSLILSLVCCLRGSWLIILMSAWTECVRVGGTRVLSDAEDDFSVHLVENWTVRDGRRSKTEVWLCSGFSGPLLMSEPYKILNVSQC